jgi:pyruvate dehydrogenase E1 component beta subunit
MANLTLVQAINLALVQEMEKDDRVLLLGEDIGINGGVFRVTEGLHKRFGEHRVVDTPLAESGIIGTSIGLAMAGLRPIPEIQFDGFLGPAYDQICSHAARMRTRTRGGLTVPLTIRVPVGGGIHAPELHSDSPENIYIHQPGLKVVMPSSPYDAKGLLIRIHASSSNPSGSTVPSAKRFRKTSTSCRSVRPEPSAKAKR